MPRSRMAPSTDMIKPAESPSRYHPIDRPSQVAISDPAMPMSIVAINPPGSLPGVRNLATAPTTSPINTTQSQCINVLRSADTWENPGPQSAGRSIYRRCRPEGLDMVSEIQPKTSLANWIPRPPISISPLILRAVLDLLRHCRDVATCRFMTRKIFLSFDRHFYRSSCGASSN
jgi:hypothetical protein